MKGVLIVGAGGHGQVLADTLLRSRELGGKMDPLGFLDDNASLKVKTTCLGLKILGSLADINKIPHDAVVVAIGDNRTRGDVFYRLKRQGEQLINVIHPSAVVAPDVEWGIGNVVFAGAIVNMGARIGNNVILNTGVSIDHHCVIGAHVHLAPGVHLGGHVPVDDGAFLGIASAVIPGRSVGAWSIVGAGGVVVEDIPPHCTAGYPCSGNQEPL